MRKLVAVEFLSLDGVMQGLGSPQEDTQGGFAHGGWGAPYAAAVDPSSSLGDTSAYLFGRKTYEKMAAFWPHQTDDNPIARHLNATPKHVATRSRTALEWTGSEPLRDGLAAAVAALKSRGAGRVTILGSGVLVHQLLQLDLIDELRLFIHPLLLGTGKRLFRSLPAPRTLSLVDVSTTPLGTVALAYARHN